MRDMWRGLILLALDEDLRTAVAAKARFASNPNLPTQCSPPLPDLTNQPDVPRLREINDLFRARGLFLGVYALAEINRWMVDGGTAFQQALAALRSKLPNSIPLGGTEPCRTLTEAAGALVADPLLKAQFQTNVTDLRGNGFEISPEQETALRKDFETGSDADFLADQIFNLGWSTSSCEGRLLVYDGMFHFNL